MKIDVKEEQFSKAKYAINFVLRFISQLVIFTSNAETKTKYGLSVLPK